MSRAPRVVLVNERLARSLTANPVTEIPADILLIFRVVGLMSGLQKRLDSRVNPACSFSRVTAKHLVWDWNGTLFNDMHLCIDIINGFCCCGNRKILQKNLATPLIIYETT